MPICLRGAKSRVGGLGAAVLVIAVLASKALLNWILSLLVPSQQLALKPIGDNMTLLLGAMGTIALSSAMAAAIAAFALDVRRYRNTQETTTQESVELGFAPLASGAGVMTALVPLLISPRPRCPPMAAGSASCRVA